MIETLNEIKKQLTKDTITEKEIVECLAIIETYIITKKSIPSPNDIWHYARIQTCKTKFTEWYIENVYSKYK